MPLRLTFVRVILRLYLETRLFTAFLLAKLNDLNKDKVINKYLLRLKGIKWFLIDLELKNGV
jgi:hypothetical protein